MTSVEVRKKFLDFFASKGHTIVPSDSLVPKDDPTVLFTTAGMQQFKRQFLGHIEGYTRAATSQKCLRTDDLDKVGKTPCHHTFFEMLGNFSFGDYFKKEAIQYAWEFLTKELKLDGEKLWVSVYEEDDEAYNEWVKMGFPKEKIVRLGDKDNFWPAEAKKNGPNGPCGPCSEIFFDYGVNPNCKSKTCDPSCNCGRFTEVWNLVFTQFNRKDGGILEPLPGKNIDTGMGLERLVAVVQGKKSNYETDLFEPILKDIKNTFPKMTETDARIVADHLRAVVFGISDGVMPSNEGRGYIIRKLIVNMINIFLKEGVDQPLEYTFVDTVIKVMGKVYPNLIHDQDRIEEVIKHTEESVKKLTKERIPELKRETQELLNTDLQNKEIIAKKIGEMLFKYKDTFGLSIATANATIASEVPKDILDLSNLEYQKYMNQQQDRSRASSKMTGDRFADIELELAGIAKTKFTGYEHMEGQAKILKLFVNDKGASKITKGDHVKIILDQTPFYAEAGGQIGDTGYLTGKHGKIRVLDTKKQDDIYLHFGEVQDGALKTGDGIEAKIDVERRKAIMCNHTATHLLQAALRKILGQHVQQQGSLVAEDRLRFDFTQPKAMSTEEISSVEATVNEIVSRKVDVGVEKLKLEEAKKKGALAFFAEKYGEEVRVITIGDFSKEFCGGTHLKNTGEIGFFTITSQGSVAQGIRRLEAKTGPQAREYLNEKQKEQAQREDLNRLRALEEEKEKRRFSEILKSVHEDLKLSPVINGTTLYTKEIEHMDVNNLKKIADAVRQSAPSSAVILGTHNDASASIIVSISDDLVARGIKANDVIKEIAPLINGSGGGRPQMAQAGSKESANVEEAIKKADSIVRTMVIS